MVVFVIWVISGVLPKKNNYFGGLGGQGGQGGWGGQDGKGYSCDQGGQCCQGGPGGQCGQGAYLIFVNFVNTLFRPEKWAPKST